MFSHGGRAFLGWVLVVAGFGACAPTQIVTHRAPVPDEAPARQGGRTEDLHTSCTSSRQCNPGQACVPFSYTSDTAGEAGLCEILCAKDGDCPSGFFCGHGAVNAQADICYARTPKATPRGAPAREKPTQEEPDAGTLNW